MFCNNFLRKHFRTIRFIISRIKRQENVNYKENIWQKINRFVQSRLIQRFINPFKTQWNRNKQTIENSDDQNEQIPVELSIVVLSDCKTIFAFERLSHEIVWFLFLNDELFREIGAVGVVIFVLEFAVFFVHEIDEFVVGILLVEGADALQILQIAFFDELGFAELVVGLLFCHGLELVSIFDFSVLAVDHVGF